MNTQDLINYESSALVLKALLNSLEDISSKNSEERFLTTRITNVISGLRKCGIDIETKTVSIPNKKKHYGKYILVKNDKNIENAILLLDYIESK